MRINLINVSSIHHAPGRGTYTDQDKKLKTLIGVLYAN